MIYNLQLCGTIFNNRILTIDAKKGVTGWPSTYACVIFIFRVFAFIPIPTLKMLILYYTILFCKKTIDAKYREWSFKSKKTDMNLRFDSKSDIGI